MQPPFEYFQTLPPDRSAVDALITAAAALLPTNPRRALEMANEALALASRLLYHSAQAQAHLLCGQVLHRLTEFQQALSHLDTAAELFDTLGDQAGEAEALVTCGTVRRELGDPTGANEALERALALSTLLTNQALRATILNHQAGLAQMVGNSGLALEHLQTALDLRRDLGDALGAAQCLNNIGQVHLSRNDLGLALKVLTEAYELLKTVDDATTTAHCLINIAYVYEELGDHQQSHGYHSRALELARASSNHTLELYCLNNLAETVSSLDRYQEAWDLYEQALTMAQQTGMLYLVGCAHHGLGRAANAQGRPGEAIGHHQQALTIAAELGEQESEVDALLGLGEANLALSRHHEARAVLERALPLALGGNLPKKVVRLRILLAEAAQLAGDVQQALDQLWTVRELERGLFDQERQRSTRQLTVQFDVERAHHEAAVSSLQTEVAQKAFQEAEAKVSQQTRKLAQTQVEVVTRLANAAEYRDDVTGEHTLRVGNVAALLAARLRLPPEDVALIRVAARLHDVGKIGISDTILQKPAKLTLDEYEVMKSHTVIGGKILSGGESPLLQMAEAIARAHHEHWDGGGYPHGLKGASIPLVARIVAVADVYDALSHSRPYKRAWTAPEVKAELARQSGRQFQPEIVEALLALHVSGDLPLRTVQEEDTGLQEVLVLSSGATRDELRDHVPAGETRLLLQVHELEARYREACRRIDSLQLAAFTDALTGLANRRAFEDELETEILHAVRHQYPLSVVSIDLDGLKLINDAEGHERGDALMKQVAQALRAHIGHAGRLYRIGGDEFAVIVKDVSVEQQQGFLDRLSLAVLDVRAAGFGSASMSAGIASFPAEATLEGDLLRLSDQRMYSNKVERRQHSVLYRTAN